MSTDRISWPTLLTGPYCVVVQVECVFYGPFKEVAGERTVRLSTDAETVRELLADLERRYPEFEGHLVDGSSLAGDTVVTEDNRDVRHLEGLETPVDPSATYRLVPSVYGG